MATLGLNPSRIEFQVKGVELDGRQRRFETLSSLGVDSLSDAPAAVVQRVWQRCIDYFHRNPYRTWFDRLEAIVNGVGASYYDGSACHLDLTQWATDPTWNSLPPYARAQLVENDVPFLERQLREEGIELLLLNGRSVMREFSAHLGSELKREPVTVDDGRVSARIYAGRFGNVDVVGWSTNLQSSFGVTREFRRKLAERLAR